MDNKLDKLMGIIIGLCLIACGLLFVIRDYFTLPFGGNNMYDDRLCVYCVLF